MSRQLKNKEILLVLAMCVDKAPDLRFQQLLYNLGITNPDKDYNHESSYTFDMIVKNALKCNIITEEDLQK